MKGNKLLSAAGWLLSMGISSVWADGVRINEVMAGYNGDSSIQFVELLVANDTHKGWGPQGTEKAGRAQLEFYDGKNLRVGRYVFSTNPAGVGQTVLVATPGYAALANALAPDVTIPREIMPISGKVCFTNNPDNPNATPFSSCVKYGGTTAAPPLPILGAQALKRVRGFDFNTADPGNSAFELGSPTPAHTSIASTINIIANLISAGGHVFAALPLVNQGEKLFKTEKFEGNSRTCGTCHIPPFFNMAPKHVAAKSPWDPLFIADRWRNINLMKLKVRSKPSDLRGQIKDTQNRSARIVKGSGNEFLITRGLGLRGVVTDEFGNKGEILSITEGDLGLPNSLNGSAHGLESSARLRTSADPRFPQGRALVLENVDGFDKLEVFRKSPTLLNLKRTAPYGFNGVQNGSDPAPSKQLAEFTKGAVIQHFPLSLQRRQGTDFRLPTQGELDALVAFQETLTLEARGNPRLADDLSKTTFNATTLPQLIGAAEFSSLCIGCHFGPALARNVGSPAGKIDHSMPLNTGVANSAINSTDALPSEPPGLAFGSSHRPIDTPQLMGVRFTAPYFHDGSAATLEDMLDFYNSDTFRTAARDLPLDLNGFGTLIRFGISPEAKTGLVAFLRTLAELPVDFPRGFSFGEKRVDSTTTGKISIKNTSPGPVTIRSSDFREFFRGTDVLRTRTVDRFDRNGLPEISVFPPIQIGDAAQFRVPTTLIGTTIPAGGTLDINVQFKPKDVTPDTSPFWSSMLTLSLEETNGEDWDIGIQLIGKSKP